MPEFTVKQRQVIERAARLGGQLMRVRGEAWGPFSRRRPELWAHIPAHLPMKIAECRDEAEYREHRAAADALFAAAAAAREAVAQ